MRTNIVIDDELMARAMRALGTRTKRETVELALRRSAGEDPLVREKQSLLEKMHKAQEMVAALPGPAITVDDFLAERRREFELEEAGSARHRRT